MSDGNTGNPNSKNNVSSNNNGVIGNGSSANNNNTTKTTSRSQAAAAAATAAASSALPSQPTPTLCGGTVHSRRGLLALLWSVVTCLTAMAFIVASIVTVRQSQKRNNSNSENYYQDGNYDYYNNEEGGGEGGEGQEQQQDQNQNNQYPQMAVTSRAMAFCALWTAVLATLLAIFGAVVLGVQFCWPTAQYYTCCNRQVHQTTPLALGSFIGAIIMFANLTLVCSVLFGEFEVRIVRLLCNCWCGFLSVEKQNDEQACSVAVNPRVT